jgi:membrane protein implicated in regulation of membrane protease activity
VKGKLTDKLLTYHIRSSRVEIQEQAAMSINTVEQAIVDETIRPQECGRVRFQSTWWPARCDRDMTFKPGDVVRVVGIDNITLIVAA